MKSVAAGLSAGISMMLRASVSVNPAVYMSDMPENRRKFLRLNGAHTHMRSHIEISPVTTTLTVVISLFEYPRASPRYEMSRVHIVTQSPVGSALRKTFSKKLPLIRLRFG